MRNEGPGNPQDKALHLVRKGDTLWGVCAEHFDDPRLWPRVWSYNPQLQNPHWIYPGDQLRLEPSSSVGGAGATESVRGGTLGMGRLIAHDPLVPPETVFLRDLGYID